MLLLTPTLPPQPQQYASYMRAVYEISQNFHKLLYLGFYSMKTARHFAKLAISNIETTWKFACTHAQKIS